MQQFRSGTQKSYHRHCSRLGNFPGLLLSGPVCVCVWEIDGCRYVPIYIHVCMQMYSQAKICVHCTRVCKICMYVCDTYIHEHLAHVRARKHTRAHMNTRLQTHTKTRTGKYACIHTHSNKHCKHSCMHIRTHKNMFTHIIAKIFFNACMHIYV